MRLSGLKPTPKGRGLRRFPIREREHLGNSASTVTVTPSPSNTVHGPHFGSSSLDHTESGSCDDCLHDKLEDSFQRLVPSLEESATRVEDLLERIRSSLGTLALEEETMFEGLRTIQTEWVILAKRADRIVLESRKLAANVAYTIKDFCGDLATFLLRPNISKQEKEKEMLAFRMRLQSEECRFKSESLEHSIQDMCRDLDGYLRTWDNVRNRKHLAGFFDDIDKLREELKQATSEVCTLLARAVFNATCIGAVIAIGVLTGDPSTFISLFSPLKGGMENVRSIGVAWKRRKEVKILLKGKIFAKHEHETVTFSKSQLSSLSTFGSKIGAIADIWTSLSNDIDSLLNYLKTSSESDDLKIFESRVTLIASLYDQLAIAFSEYSRCLT